MKFLSLLKATFSEDMNLFKYSAGRNASPLKKILLPVFLFLLVTYSIGIYAYEIAKVLAPLNLTYIMLSIFLMMVTVISFMEGIHKSQGILFEARDNDLLFSLPIKKSYILASRIIKLIVFQYIFNLMFLLPAIVVYIYFEQPGLYFYILSFIMTLLIPIIPTVISSFLGYIILMISSRTRKRKFIQLILTSLLLIAIMFFSSNSSKLVNNLVLHAKTIQEFLTQLYYPIGAYSLLINEFDFLLFIKLLLVHIIPFFIFIILGQRFYFNIISNMNNSSSISNSHKKKYKNNVNSIIVALVKKELSRYFSSPIYIFNTSFGLIMIVVISIALSIKGQKFLTDILLNYGVSENISINVLFYEMVLLMLLMTSISSSSISLEGKTILFTKSLPVSYKKIFLSKILNCYIIELPFIIVSLIIFTVSFQVKIYYIIEILLLAIFTILFMSTSGLLINLKYPKLNASNDTEVVKQSMSSTLSVFVGIGTFLVSVICIIYLSKWINIDYLLIFNIMILGIASCFLYFILIKKGPSIYQKLSV